MASYKGTYRPVPCGVSVGNDNECASGTIGCVVVKNGVHYALSNNHVYARQNDASLGEEVDQPGLYDTNCSYDPNNYLGTLSAFWTIDFSGGNNKVDAAIAFTTTAYLGNATPSNGYGTPNSTPVTVYTVGQGVKKYGRTTALTTGNVVVAAAGNNVAVANINAPVLLSNNTGPVHLAAAVGTPVVVLYALTNPQHIRAFEGARRSLRRAPRQDAIPFRRWLVRVAVNLAKNHLRDESRFTRAPLEALGAAESAPPAAW